jgi:type I restriction enzyme S subunit
MGDTALGSDIKYWSIGSVLQRNQGMTVTAAQMKAFKSGSSDVRIFAGGATFVDTDRANVPPNGLLNGPAIIVKSRGNIGFEFWIGLFSHKNELWSYSPKHAGVNIKYVFYYLESQTQRLHELARSKSVKMPQLAVGDIDSLVMPFPEISVQDEIVRVLDTLGNLKTELEAELDARKKQFEVLKERLLAPALGWSAVELGDLAEIYDGPHATPTKTLVGPWYLSISSLKDGHFDFSESAHLTEEELPKWTKRVKPLQGDTLFSYETRLGQAAYWNYSQDAALGRRMGLLRPKREVILPEFLTWLYLSPAFQSQIASRTVKGSTVDRFPIANMAHWPVSIPDLRSQEIIVEALGHIDELCNRGDTGIPAELAARRKQYEHYRDQLLTFKEA